MVCAIAKNDLNRRISSFSPQKNTLWVPIMGASGRGFLLVLGRYVFVDVRANVNIFGI